MAAEASTTRIQVRPVTGLPEVKAGDDVISLIADSLSTLAPAITDGDVVVVAQKIVSKAQNRFARLSEVTVSPEADALALKCDKDPRLVQLVLQESRGVVRTGPGILIAQHISGHIMANAGIDRSNVRGDEDTVLLLPLDPDGWCASAWQLLSNRLGVQLGVVMADSFGRPWRIGTAGVAIGAAGMVARKDVRGMPDRFGRVLESTEIGVADEVAAAASLVMGQTNEGVPVVVISGLDCAGEGRAADLLRSSERDLFR
ncbi:MAG: coenzyme F420-0:L-glutamate ligase [Rhodospirillaceae bacterium]|jgi:coenzyme F420-0:L-glutamate ligase / coenzyme F420-1:gamma-L-glutamate ligase|nr:coenzyme F420-0:L-glutamate ligase [Rhodospirillaceae bacterium]